MRKDDDDHDIKEEGRLSPVAGQEENCKKRFVRADRKSRQQGRAFKIGCYWLGIKNLSKI